MIDATIIPVCIFAKPPVPEEVKTRLIPLLGATGAAQLASAMLLDVWQTVKSCPGVRPILATTLHGEFPVYASPEDIWLQGEGDLGQRIEQIMTRGLLHSSAVIAVGADSPTLTCAHLRAALAALQTNDAVIGPSMDGGFYLLGLRRCQPGLFFSLPWSAANTREALRVRLEKQQLTVAELDLLFDVDTPDDLLSLEKELVAHPSLAPATRAWCYQNRMHLSYS